MSVNDFATRNTTSSQEAAEAAIARYEQTEELIQAFAHLDKEQVRRVAQEQENNTGPLKGLVIGIKDLINTADAPATYGSPIYRDNRPTQEDRKSTRLNSSHVKISYAVFCLKKKN